jgi:hypothetical protein
MYLRYVVALGDLSVSHPPEQPQRQPATMCSRVPLVRRLLIIGGADFESGVIERPDNRAPARNGSRPRRKRHVAQVPGRLVGDPPLRIQQTRVRGEIHKPFRFYVVLARPLLGVSGQKQVFDRFRRFIAYGLQEHHLQIADRRPAAASISSLFLQGVLSPLFLIGDRLAPRSGRRGHSGSYSECCGPNSKNRGNVLVTNGHQNGHKPPPTVAGFIVTDLLENAGVMWRWMSTVDGG